MGFFKALVARFQWIVLAFVLGAAIGGYAGWQEKTYRVDAAQAKALKDVRKADVAAVNTMQKTETKIQEAKTETQVRFKTITKEIIKYVPQTVPPAQQADRPDSAAHHSQGDRGDCAAPVLTVDAVRLLNAARTDQDIDPTSLGNAEGEASTDIGLQEVVRSDLEVTELYHELAKNHNACVDYVQSLIDEQNLQLNH